MLTDYLQLFADGSAGGDAQAADGGLDFAKVYEQRTGRKPRFAASERATAETPEADARTDGDAGQEAHAEESKTEDPKAARKRGWEKAKADYKEELTEDVGRMLGERMKKHNADLTAANEKYDKLLNAVGPYLAKLGVDAGDVDAIEKAAMEDSTNFRNRAVEKGITVEEAIEDYRNEAAQAQKKRAQEAADEAARAQAAEAAERQKFEAMRSEEAEVQKLDPDFNLAQEIVNNEEFSKMIDAGVSVMSAYKATHFDDRMAAVAGAVERQTAINTAQKIAAGQKRPVEGGIGTNAGVGSTVGYKQMTREQILAIHEKVMSGR